LYVFLLLIKKSRFYASNAGEFEFGCYIEKGFRYIWGVMVGRLIVGGWGNVKSFMKKRRKYETTDGTEVFSVNFRGHKGEGIKRDLTY